MPSSSGSSRWSRLSGRSQPMGIFCPRSMATSASWEYLLSHSVRTDMLLSFVHQAESHRLAASAALQRGSPKNHADCAGRASEIIFCKTFNGLNERAAEGRAEHTASCTRQTRQLSFPAVFQGMSDRILRGKAELTRHPTAPRIVHYRTMSDLQHSSRGAILCFKGVSPSARQMHDPTRTRHELRRNCPMITLIE